MVLGTDSFPTTMEAAYRILSDTQSGLIRIVLDVVMVMIEELLDTLIIKEGRMRIDQVSLKVPIL